MTTRTLLETGQRLPMMTVESVDGGAPVPLRRSGRKATVLVTLHRECDACRAYLDALAHEQAGIDEWDGRVAATFANEATADAGIPAPAVLIADQWGELFVIEPAGNGHAFIEPAEVLSWLRYLAVQCPECQGEAL